MIEVGLIGFGLAGRAFHAPVIRAVSGMRLAAILQRSGDEAASAYPDVRVVRSLDELLTIKEIRLIVVATPNESHFPLAERCLKAGRDVIVDKPFALDYEQAAALVALANRNSRFLAVYHNRRFDGDFHAIRELVASGALGRIVRFETCYDRYRPLPKPGGAWREAKSPGAGVTYDLAPHLLDHALTLFGVPEALTADIRIERDAVAVDDSFDIMLHYPRGLRAVLGSSILAAAQRPRFVLLGTQGSYFKHTFDPTENNLRTGKIPATGPWGAEPEENWGVLTAAHSPVEFSQRRIPSAAVDYRDYYANVRDVLLGKAQPLVTHEQALNVMRALDLARASAAKRCTLPWLA